MRTVNLHTFDFTTNNYLFTLIISWFLSFLYIYCIFVVRLSVNSWKADKISLHFTTVLQSMRSIIGLLWHLFTFQSTSEKAMVPQIKTSEKWSVQKTVTALCKAIWNIYIYLNVNGATALWGFCGFSEAVQEVCVRMSVSV